MGRWTAHVLVALCTGPDLSLPWPDEEWSRYWTNTRNSLRALSEQSGGFALGDGEDLVSTLARISDAVRQ